MMNVKLIKLVLDEAKKHKS